jgi:hypothetical protein
MQPLDQRTYTFIIKVWQERRDIPGAAVLWRGSATDVASKTRIYFDSLSELCDFLVQRCGMPASALGQDGPA